MHINTRAIVLKTIDYSDNSFIANLYTENLGKRSFIVKGAKKSSSKNKMAFFQPLSLVNISFHDLANKNLHYIKEIKFEEPYNFIGEDINKSFIILYMAEFLGQCLKEEESNPSLFQFIFSSLEWLTHHQSVHNFHLVFTIQLSKYLGFFPQGKFSELTNVFDMENGEFVSVKPGHDNFLEHKKAKDFHTLLNLSYSQLDLLKISNIERRELLDSVSNYYKIHQQGFKTLKSAEILETVLN